MKICSKCKVEKGFGEFNKDKSKKDGLCCKCKECIKEHYKENREEINRKNKEYQKKNGTKLLEQKKEYREKNKEKIRQRRKEYRKNNRIKLLEQSKRYWLKNRAKLLERKREYDKKNREKLNKQKKEYIKERRKNDPNFRIACRLRRRTNVGIISQGGIKSASTQELLGCSFDEARIHIENQFIEGMCWENYPDWEIDHIRPCASFDLTDPEQQKQCFHWSNLQPMWAENNLKKSSIYNGVKY